MFLKIFILLYVILVFLLEIVKNIFENEKLCKKSSSTNAIYKIKLFFHLYVRYGWPNG